jgi:hypothetical protein
MASVSSKIDFVFFKKFVNKEIEFFLNFLKVKKLEKVQN